MKEMPKTNIKSVALETFALSSDPSGRELLKEWVWHEVSPEGVREGNYERDVEWSRQTIASMADALCSNHEVKGWLSLFGPFLPDAILGAAHALINAQDGPRFFLPEVFASKGGRGYVETLFNVEWARARFERLFGETPETGGWILPVACRCSVLLAPEADFEALGRAAFFDVELHASKLLDEARVALSKGTYLILPSLDLEWWYLGAKEPCAQAAVDLLRRLWPDAEWERD
jgi:hypothetical protein